MLHKRSKEFLQGGKNLLAFSGGGDSTALFFLLLEEGIEFDIAIVDYGQREQSKEEVAYAQALAQKYNKVCYVHEAGIIEQNFEATARSIRYDFFEKIILQYHYETLLTAHHLGDKLEWFLMQLCKGAGCVELLGMQEKEQREYYTLLRPLLHVEKTALQEYLHQRKIHYFEDATNQDEVYKRNLFRKKFAEPLLAEYAQGIARSFSYMQEDISASIQEITLQHLNQLTYFKSEDTRSNLVAIDRYLKTQGHVMSAHERRMVQSESSCVLGRKYVVAQMKGYVFIAPYLHVKGFEKAFKERCRILKIAPKLRPYLWEDAEALALVSSLLQ